MPRGRIGHTGTGWPASATSLSRELARISPKLRTVGIEVEKRREAHGRRLVVIGPIPEPRHQRHRRHRSRALVTRGR